MAQLISQLCDELQQLSTYQETIQPFEGDPSTRGRLTSIKNKSSTGNFQHQYLLELLVSMYSYHLMVKSVSCYCRAMGSNFSVVRLTSCRSVCIESLGL